MDAQQPEPLNYFNYFTEIEEHFQRARGTSLFLMSPLDWALIETWKDAGVPLEAVLRGIDLAFEKWRTKKIRGRQVNSLAYCTQAVTDEAERMAQGLPAGNTAAPVEAPFTIDELRGFLSDAAARLVGAQYGSVKSELEKILSGIDEHYRNLESLEQQLSGMEDKLVAIARSTQPEAELTEARRAMDAELRPYRGKMSAPQLAMLERQYLDRRVLEGRGLPRLSLFYLR